MEHKQSTSAPLLDASDPSQPSIHDIEASFNGKNAHFLGSAELSKVRPSTSALFFSFLNTFGKTAMPIFTLASIGLVTNSFTSIIISTNGNLSGQYIAGLVFFAFGAVFPFIALTIIAQKILHNMCLEYIVFKLLSYNILVQIHDPEPKNRKFPRIGGLGWFLIAGTITQIMMFALLDQNQVLTVVATQSGSLFLVYWNLFKFSNPVADVYKVLSADPKSLSRVLANVRIWSRNDLKKLCCAHLIKEFDYINASKSWCEKMSRSGTPLAFSWEKLVETDPSTVPEATGYKKQLMKGFWAYSLMFKKGRFHKEEDIKFSKMIIGCFTITMIVTGALNTYLQFKAVMSSGSNAHTSSS